MSSIKRKNEGGALAAGDSNASKKPKVNGSITSFFGAPKAGAAAACSTSSASSAAAAAAAEQPPTLKFDKEKWAAGLTDEQRRLLSLEIQTMDPSWLAVLKDELVTPQFIELKKFLDREAGSGKKIFPPREDIYSWSRHTPFHAVKCVILGQDPYHNVNQAHGLAFSVRPPTPAPPSLRNMYTALRKDYPAFRPPPHNGGLLTPWAERGVLMLNTCLTVRAHEANSHANRGWERLTQRAIDLVAQRRARGVVFLAWGTPAGKRVQKVDRARHLVLQSAHPSPLSASRGFFDCGHFRKANEWIAARYGPAAEIDWNLNPSPSPSPSAPAGGSASSGNGNGNGNKAKPASAAAKPVPKQQQQKEKKQEEKDEYDDGDEDEDALAAAADAAAAEAAKAKEANKTEDAKAEDAAEAETDADEPAPVVAVGEVKEGSKKGEEKSEILEKEGEVKEGSKKGEEKSEILEKEGEDGTAPAEEEEAGEEKADEASK